MPKRAMWKGVVKVGSATAPVKLYAAVQDVNVHFHVMQQRTATRVRQEMVSEDREPVEKEKVRKGYEIERGTFVILEPSELQKLKPKESRTISLLRFVPDSALGIEWYERPYYLGPDGETEKYFALVEALEKSNRLGIASWSMRGKSYVGALRVQTGYLALIKLRYAQEVLSSRDLPAPSGRQLDAKELRMAKELVGALEGKFEASEFRDEYRERLEELLRAKAKGKRPRLPKIKERETGGSLDKQLAKSLQALKRGREKKVA